MTKVLYGQAPDWAEWADAEPVTPLPEASTRSCGDCRLCCNVMAVHEINEPRGEWCPSAELKAGVGGCRVYDDRPTSCRDFECLWLVGIGAEEDRPDKSRVVVTALDPLTNRVRHPVTRKNYHVLALQEAQVGAVERSRGRRTLEAALALNFGVVVNTVDRARRVYYPDRSYLDLDPDSNDSKLSDAP